MVKINYQDCIAACNDCAFYCDLAATACLKQLDMANMARCIELDMYCAEICRAAVSFMIKEDEFSTEICKICAEICENCAQECDNYLSIPFQECAAACRKCATTCRQMAA
ncbi:ferredoxin [Anditalea andensis]|uniref:Ferredoxin n=1 Tax=Anditalea andensis TaxID=1048983 RepID=A0A074L627_9BACT|nr:ferredoxin [Anditalea andensis]